MGLRGQDEAGQNERKEQRSQSRFRGPTPTPLENDSRGLRLGSRASQALSGVPSSLPVCPQVSQLLMVFGVQAHSPRIWILLACCIPSWPGRMYACPGAAWPGLATWTWLSAKWRGNCPSGGASRALHQRPAATSSSGWEQRLFIRCWLLLRREPGLGCAQQAPCLLAAHPLPGPATLSPRCGAASDAPPSPRLWPRKGSLPIVRARCGAKLLCSLQ